MMKFMVKSQLVESIFDVINTKTSFITLNPIAKLEKKLVRMIHS